MNKMEIQELKQSANPMNEGNDYGMGMIRKSIQTLGFARSIVCDKNNIVIVGDKVFQYAQQIGANIQVIETTGDTLVVVKRTDIDATSKRGLELAMVDNLSASENLEWDAHNVRQSAILNHGFNPIEWGGDCCVVEELRIEDLLKEGVKQIPQKKEKEFKQPTQLSLFD